MVSRANTREHFCASFLWSPVAAHLFCQRVFQAQLSFLNYLFSHQVRLLKRNHNRILISDDDIGCTINRSLICNHKSKDICQIFGLLRRFHPVQVFITKVAFLPKLWVEQRHKIVNCLKNEFCDWRKWIN